MARQSGAATVDEVMLYNKPDRQKVLLEGARKEGKITWYTSLIIDQVVRPVKEAFEKKYPFIQIEPFRGNSGADRAKNVRRVSGQALRSRHHRRHGDRADGAKRAATSSVFIRPISPTIRLS